MVNSFPLPSLGDFGFFEIIYVLWVLWLGIFLRGFRTKLLVGQRLSYFECVFLNLIEAGLNSFLPLRAGEIGKFVAFRLFGFLSRDSIVVVAFEKIIDVCVLLALLVLVLAVLLDSLIYVVFGLVLLISSFLVLRFASRVILNSQLKLFRDLSMVWGSIATWRVRSVLGSFIVGILLVAIGLFSYWYVGSKVVGIEFSAESLVAVYFGGIIGMLIAFLPGGLGTFELSVVFAGSLAGISAEDVLEMVLILRLLLLVAYVPFALFGLLVVRGFGANFIEKMRSAFRE